MTKPTNHHPLRYGNEHGEIRFGHIIEQDQFGFFVRTGDDGGRHYLNLRTTGDVPSGQKGSTNFHSPGSFTVDCGQDITNSTDASPTAIDLYAHNGDINLSAPHGTIRLYAKNIDLITDGTEDGDGRINLYANQTITLESPNIDIKSTVATNIFSENMVKCLGERIMNIYGGLIEIVDGGTTTLGSKTNDREATNTGKIASVFEAKMTPALDELKVNEGIKAGVSAVKKLAESGIVDDLKSFAESDAVADLTEQVGELRDLGEGLLGSAKKKLSLFEKDLSKEADKIKDILKDL